MEQKTSFAAPEVRRYMAARMDHTEGCPHLEVEQLRKAWRWSPKDKLNRRSVTDSSLLQRIIVRLKSARSCLLIIDPYSGVSRLGR